MYNSDNQVLTKYADFIKENPDYLQKVIDDPDYFSFIKMDVDLGVVVDREIETLDSSTFMIDTLKYTKLYPRRESSGFNSDTSSANESALRKTLLEYEREHRLDLEQENEQEKELEQEEFYLDEVIVDKKIETKDAEIFENNHEFGNDSEDPFATGKNQEIEFRDVDNNRTNLNQLDNNIPPSVRKGEFISNENLEESHPSALEEYNDFDIAADIQSDDLIVAQTKTVIGPNPGRNFKSLYSSRSNSGENINANKSSEDHLLVNANFKPPRKAFSKDSDKFFKTELVGNPLLIENVKALPQNAFVDPEVPLGKVSKIPFPGSIPIPIAYTEQKLSFERIPIQNIPNTLLGTLKSDFGKITNNHTCRIPNQNITSFSSIDRDKDLNIYNHIHTPTDSKQVVRYPNVLPPWSPPEIRKKVNYVPPILRRYNMDQWVAKIIWLYKNGDERHPKIEYRFRPDKDVRSFEGLCDILSQRLGLTRGVRFIYSLSGRPILNLEQLRHENSYVVSSTKKFKALNYGADSFSDHQGNKKVSPLPPARVSLPPVIRVRKDRSLKRFGSDANGRSKSPQPSQKMKQQVQYLNFSAINDVEMIKRNSPASEAQKLVNAVIGEAHPVQRKVVRIINGENPSIQSQVLLNTRVSQEWEDLVRDLSMAVKFPKMSKYHLETLIGRKVLSYSQLRAELNAGNQTFYIYGNNERVTSRNSKTTNSQSIDSLGNMRHLSLQDSVNNLPPPALKRAKSKSQIPRLSSNNNNSSSSNNVTFDISRSDQKVGNTNTIDLSGKGKGKYFDN